jgi:hypothetical protein
MISDRSIQLVARACLLVLTIVLGACSKESSAPQADTGKTPPTVENKAPLITKPQIADWCKEHGVPESICTRCNDSLIAEFKQKGDWCNEHALPESQCIACHPELEAKFKAMEPTAGGR